MNEDYAVWLCTPGGKRLLFLDDLFAFTASRVLGGIGRFNGVTTATFDPAFIQRDNVIQVNYRGRLWRTYFLRRWRWERQKGARVLLFKDCPCCNELLMRRIVAAYEGSAQGEMTDFADDMLKQVVTDSQSDLTLPTPDAGTRTWSQLSIDSQWGKGPALTLSFAGERLLLPSGSGALAQIVEAAREAKKPVFFDIVPVLYPNKIEYVFRTYLDQIGADLRDRFTFGEALDTLADGYYEEDWTEEINYVYGGGEGAGASRTIVQKYDGDRYGASIWARREGFLDAPGVSDTALPDATNVYLQAHDGIIRAGGIPLDTDKIQFGRDWYFGDRVKVRVEKSEGFGAFEEFDATVTVGAIGIQEDGSEIREIRFSYES